MLNLIKGNATSLEYSIKIDGGIPQDFSSVTKSTFMAKVRSEDENSDAVISIVSLQGEANPQITLDDPVTGSVTVRLFSTDTDVPPDKYVYALQLEWTPSNVIEFKFGDGFLKIEQDVIR